MTANNSHNSAIQYLRQRLDQDYVERRLTKENSHHQRVLSTGHKLFHVENWYSIHGFIRHCFRAIGLHGRGQRNARELKLNHNTIALAHLPSAFDGFRILHLSDLHLDMDRGTTHALNELVRQVDYDLCVLTGDYRANTFGDSVRCMDILEQTRLHLSSPIYAILGNHDSLMMLPRMEQMGIRVLVNEATTIAREDQHLGLAGIDDAHYFQMDDIDNAVQDIGNCRVKILLSHTPETYQHAARVGFDIFFCGHTHGGQICLPGGIPVILEANCPRRLGKGAWKHEDMQGYTSVGASTSVVNLRFNCPPEITVHRLQRLSESSEV